MSDTFDAQKFLAHLPLKAGVYQMLDKYGKVLYIGKAKKLKQRLRSYFQRQHPDSKTRALLGKIDDIQFTLTHTETEALILEYNLIKTHQPPYNILLRDDKSYPYLFVSEELYPKIQIRRGIKTAKGDYFGPYPSAGAVRESLQLLQKLFPVRQCEDIFFKHRSHPCLQYQIKRCSAPS
jgi:excinuclease ABC subunit C